MAVSPKGYRGQFIKTSTKRATNQPSPFKNYSSVNNNLSVNLTLNEIVGYVGTNGKSNKFLSSERSVFLPQQISCPNKKVKTIKKIIVEELPYLERAERMS
jgi:hypothetical protein